MKITDIYKLPVQSVGCVSDLGGAYFAHLPDLIISPDLWTPEQIEAIATSVKVEVRIHKHVQFDSRRFWRLASVWYNDHPVMVIQNAGREGDDYAMCYITDKEMYVRMYVEINTVLAQQVLPELDGEFCKIKFVADDFDCPTSFYGHNLSEAGYFNLHGYTIVSGNKNC